jgi:para-nitrobenzyl esterase
MMRWMGVAALVAAAAGCSSGGSKGGNDGGPPMTGPLDVTTDKGVVHGASNGTARVFLGIPYAAPPTGSARFMPPTDAPAWTSPRDATALGAECAQLDMTGALASGSSEDCLFVNVWTPLATVTNAPVFVWIHGGGFIEGSGGDPTYDGSNISQKTNSIVVTLNYRLGALGFLSHPAFAAAEKVATSPSVGLQDQQAALQWVQRNIAAFGGAPGNVTVAGESAGGISVCAHLAMPASKGNFAHAIIESGVCIPSPGVFQSKAAAEDQGNRLATAVGCTDASAALGCLQGKNPLQILAALPGRKAFFGPTGDSFTPVLDGTVLPMAPLDAITAGSFAKVPTILGTNLNEGELFLYLWGSPPPASADVRGALSLLFGATQIAAIAAQYPVDSDPSKAFVDIVTDGAFACPARRTARALAAAGVAPYLYQFTYPFTVALAPNITATHSFELPFVFRNAYLGAQLSANDLAVADSIDGYWFSFVASGDPNASREMGTAMWPIYTMSGDQNIVLDAPTSVGSHLKQSICDFWDTLK